MYTLTNKKENPPKCIETMKGEDGESFVDLTMRLEENKVLKFEF